MISFSVVYTSTALLQWGLVERCGPKPAALGLLHRPGSLCCGACGRGSILWPEAELQTTHLCCLGSLRSWDHWLKSSWHLKVFLQAGFLFFLHPCTIMWFKLVNILFSTISGVKYPWWLPAWSSECLIFCCSLLSTWTCRYCLFFQTKHFLLHEKSWWSLNSGDTQW